MVHHVKDNSDLEAQLNCAGGKLVVIDFSAAWCGPCKMITPKLEELAVQYADRVLVLKVDVDECEDIAMKYNVSSMPTFFFIKNGTTLDHFSGANADTLSQRFAQHA